MEEANFSARRFLGQMLERMGHLDPSPGQAGQPEGQGRLPVGFLMEFQDQMIIIVARSSVERTVNYAN